jgi:hypothetical protein
MSRPINSSKRVPPPPSTSSSSNQSSSLLKTIAEGAAFGTGTNLASKAVNNTSSSHPQRKSTVEDNYNDYSKNDELCEKYVKMYEHCIQRKESCQDIIDKVGKYC